MHWLQSLDVGLFRFINGTLSNPFFDWVMPFLSGNALSFRIAICAVILLFAWLIWKNPARAAVCALMLALIIWPGDTFICNKIKHAIGRPRPFVVMPETRLPASKNADAGMASPRSGMGVSVGMPSSHAANWGAVTMIFCIYYRRRSLCLALPLALAVSFSRVYNGVHYPSDVLVGLILGAGYAAGGVWTANALWQWSGRRWFPNWWRKFPSLLAPEWVKT